ncbi:uncharacterized protein DSM5745_10994 [Aspergillus mulundensis]|uniref:Hydantoinase B/oxoprolinase domain-containing protein n=1 Tax=Aspergillus mulundensis TaxID=1810919 RepID=A0A3D8QC00_9EURO|nr:hypothetical protein DSM5745_10994 [Aspergillus mulundensis]RDW59299.1 hypothetical protein DSM5745_10994 [Aspergillus mulundensis]
MAFRQFRNTCKTTPEGLRPAPEVRAVHGQLSDLPLQAVDYMDDRSKLCLQVKINREDGSATFNFTGTSREIYGSLNAQRVTLSAITYVLRSLVNSDIPLNQGCLVSA